MKTIFLNSWFIATKKNGIKMIEETKKEIKEIMANIQPYKGFADCSLNDLSFIRDLQKLYNMPAETAQQIHEQILDMEGHNITVGRKRHQACLEIEAYLDDLFRSFGIAVKVTKGKTVKRTKAYSTLYDEIITKYRLYYNSPPNWKNSYSVHTHMVNGVEIDCVNLRNRSNTFIDYYNNLKLEVDKQIKQRDYNNKRLQMTLVNANELHLNIEGKTENQIFNEVNEILGARWLDEQYPVGTLMQINSCDECDTYTRGDRRCTCGNRRISCYAEGDFMNGYYVTTEYY